MPKNYGLASTTLLFLCCGAATSGCSGQEPPAEPLDQAMPTYQRYACADAGEVLVRYVGPDTLEIKVGDKLTSLPRERSASGAKFAKDATLFWNKGDEAILEIAGVRYNCHRDAEEVPVEGLRKTDD